MKRTIIFSLLFLFSFSIFAQDDAKKKENKSVFTASGEVRARTEYKHGYKSPVAKWLILDEYKMPASLYTSQRTRLNLGYKASKVKFGVVLQDVRTWGSQKQLVGNEANATSIHQAWGEVFFTPEISLKVGRMELAYDDHRILGSVGWAQQARSHDLALFKYEGSIKAHLGLAFHGGPFTGVLNDNYKAMQFLWINGKAGPLAYSVLALNNGLAEAGVWYNAADLTSPIGVAESNAYSQTLGGHFKYKTGPISISFNTYYQMGKKPANWVDTKSLPTGVTAAMLGLKEKAGEGQKISAYNVGLDAMFKANDNLKIGLGYEMLSGNDLTDANRTDENAFTPLYGTNHKFNGWMDYFYVGNHGSSVGLQDINLKLIFKSGKFFAKLIPHYFMAAGKMKYTDNDGNEQDLGSLGTEIDLWAGYNIVPKVASIQFGYSHMLPTDGLYALKGGSVDMSLNGTNNWAWIMVVLKPKFLNYSK